jgi:hypothetical protein
MRAKGINYDTGFLNRGVSSRPSFEPSVVRRELQIIRDDLHCNAVRVTGGDADRLEQAATIAAELGLEVWFSPFTCDLSFDEMRDLLVDCAERAERLRQGGAKVVLVLGAEISLLNRGFLPGELVDERLALLRDPIRFRQELPKIPPLINQFFATTVPLVRERFSGKLSYAAMPFEGVDWALFDFVSLDLYRSAQVADRFADAIHTLVAQGKPVAITEFGAVTFTGAADLGAGAIDVVEWDHETVQPLGLKGEFVRNEREQAEYLHELLEAFDTAGVDSVFVFTFVMDQLPHREPPAVDLDLASYGVVKVYEQRSGTRYPDMAWEPKLAFDTLAAYYKN